MSSDIESCDEDREASPLRIKWVPPENGGSIVDVQAWFGDNLIYSDKFDMLKASAREKFADKLCKHNPGIDRDEVVALLQKIVPKIGKGRAGKPPEGGGGGYDPDAPDDDTLAKKAVDNPHRLARKFLENHFSHQDGPTLVYHRDEFHKHDGTRYVPYRDANHDLVAEVEAEFNRSNRQVIARMIAAARASGKKPELKDMPDAQKVTTGVIKNTMQALESETVISFEIDAPCWIDAGEDALQSRPPATGVMAARNGLVDLRDMTIIPHTPLFFSPYTLSYDFSPSAPAPVNWEMFLSSSWPDDPASIRELRKWFGYLLTLDTSKQKMLLLLGPPRCGKGTIARVMMKLMGEHNTAFPSLDSLANNFGLSPLLGKAVAIIPDAKLEGSTADKSIILERLLNITGEDGITIDRKYRDPINVKLPTRITMLANRAPDFRDASGALDSRVFFLKMTTSWLGREDHGLTEKLWGELPGILMWATEGRRMLEEDGNFFTPDSAKETKEAFGEMTSPIRVFVEDCCRLISPDDRDKEDLRTTRDVYHAYAEWCRDSGKRLVNDNVFSRDLQAAFPELKQERPRVFVPDESGDMQEDRSRRFRGINLTEYGLSLMHRHRERDEPRSSYPPIRLAR